MLIYAVGFLQIHFPFQYAFGENDCYHVSKAFFGFRQWLQQNLQIGLPLICGRMCTLIPLKVQMHMEVRLLDYS